MLEYVLFVVTNYATKESFEISFNPLLPYIRMHILHTVLYTSFKVLTRNICLSIKSFFKLVIIFFILVILLRDSGVIV